MSRVIAVCACLALLAGVAPRTVAVEYVVDQDQSLASLLLAGLGTSDLWQSFRQSSNVISGAGVFLFPTVPGEGGKVRIELWDGPPKSDGGGTKGDRLAFADADGVDGTWVDVFWTPVASDPATTYFLVFEGMGQANRLGLAGAQFAYQQGDAYVQGAPFPTYDYTFRTYGPPVPEPTSAALLAAGLVMLIAAALRRRPARAG